MSLNQCRNMSWKQPSMYCPFFMNLGTQRWRTFPRRRMTCIILSNGSDKPTSDQTMWVHAKLGNTKLRLEQSRLHLLYLLPSWRQSVMVVTLEDDCLSDSIEITFPTRSPRVGVSWRPNDHYRVCLFYNLSGWVRGVTVACQIKQTLQGTLVLHCNPYFASSQQT